VGVNALLDTNIVLRLLAGQLASPLPALSYGVSVITEMELLSFPGISETEETGIKRFLASVEIVELTPAVRAAAVQLRRISRLKLPDAIIGATSLVSAAELFTNDDRLARTPGLRCRSLALK
jgi:predicted nucleic acid-binding protein